MTIVMCNLDFTTNCSRVKGEVFARCDLKFINRRELISVYPKSLDTLAIII